MVGWLSKVKLTNAKVGFRDTLGFLKVDLIDEGARIIIEHICAWEYSTHYSATS